MAKPWRRFAEVLVLIGGAATAAIFIDDVRSMVATLRKPGRKPEPEIEPTDDDGEASESVKGDDDERGMNEA